jgi:C1A family cysteine protease
MDFDATEIQFQSWMTDQKKQYANNAEYLHRMAIFSVNIQKIQKMNENSYGGATFAINEFADLTEAEFAETYLGYVPSGQPESTRDVLALTGYGAPDKFSWNDKGKLTAVKDQKQCGSCWAFSATENIESVWMIAKDLTPANMKDLAPQQIVDCDKHDGGCNGGNPPTAYEYVISAGGMDTEASYPYKAVNEACHFLKDDVFTKISSYKYATKTRSEEEMKEVTATVAPISICVDAQPWQFYSSGIMMRSQCGTSLDHCVQVEGYDTSASTPFWNVRNSWGTRWGEKGYIRLQYGQNTCGLAHARVFGKEAKPAVAE